MKALSCAAALAAALGLACEDVSHRDIGDEINILVRRNDALVPPAIERLAKYRRAAIPQIETALHTSAPTGRLHLVTALDRIGDAEAVPILRHLAVYDISADVREATEALLRRWSMEGEGERADRARAALREVARKRAAGLGPLVFGDGGIPGVPSTIGAPPPVGGGPKP